MYTDYGDFAILSFYTWTYICGSHCVQGYVSCTWLSFLFPSFLQCRLFGSDLGTGRRVMREQERCGGTGSW